MAVKKNTEANRVASGESASAGKKKKKPADGARETVESIAIAFVLAFLFKTFQAEAYVIPTGSMAPTLYGRHKEVECDGCGFHFALGASSEVDQSTGQLIGRIRTAYCSNCGKRIDAAKEAPVFNGDRILVNKQIGEFKRFDVVVFKNPEQPHINYIKRLVGLPNETIRVRKGDLWALREGETSWEILRKDDPFVQKDIQLTVYDDSYPARELIELGWPERWVSATYRVGNDSVGNWQAIENGWSADRNARTYACDAGEGDFQWLRYRNFQPNDSSWPVAGQANPDLSSAEATLISDFCSFNAYGERSRGQEGYWVGDLTINAQVSVDRIAGKSEMLIELVEGAQAFQCVINLSTGSATLQYLIGGDRDAPVTMGTGSTGMTAAGSYDITFANVDDRICLWVDNQLIEFDGETEYVASDVPQPETGDLAPVGIAFRDAAATVSGLLLQRDIYYRNDVVQFNPADGVSVSEYSSPFVRRDEVNTYQRNEVDAYLLHLLNNPAAWASTYAQASAAQLSSFGQYGDYKLASDEYLMFGDNSSMSKDGRLFDYETRPMGGVFSHRYAVREKDLIGKALFIFWPHGVPFLNGGKGFSLMNHKTAARDDRDDDYPSFRFPFYPDISRMKKIR